MCILLLKYNDEYHYLTKYKILLIYTNKELQLMNSL